ncbi:MAG: dephospho-CoA kinase [Candidatus Brocadiia bacterium]
MRPATRTQETPVLGIIGGLGAGKSTAARLLGKRGAAVIDADRIAHRALERPEVKEELVRAFGQDILDEDGHVERSGLARRAFEDEQSAQRLNQIVHPPVITEVKERISALRETRDVPLIVLDAPLLVEAGLHEEQCQGLLFVHAPEKLRRRRMRKQRGMTHDQFRRRSRVQISPQRKRELADFVVENDGTMEELDEQIEELWPEFCGISGGYQPANPTQ